MRYGGKNIQYLSRMTGLYEVTPYSTYVLYAGLHGSMVPTRGSKQIDTEMTHTRERTKVLLTAGYFNRCMFS